MKKIINLTLFVISILSFFIFISFTNANELGSRSKSIDNETHLKAQAPVQTENQSESAKGNIRNDGTESQLYAITKCSNKATIANTEKDLIITRNTKKSLGRVDTEGPETCKALSNKIEQDKCFKILEVARAMIILAERTQLNHIACR
jgi:hypothetical protein